MKNEWTEKIEKLERENKEMLEALKDVFTYLDTPHKSPYGNVEIIDRAYKVLTKIEAK